MPTLQRIVFSGRSITGAEYQHLQEGPAPRRGLPARELKRDGAIEKVYKPSVVGEPLHVIVPKRKPYPIFSKREKEIVNRIIEEFKDLTGSELSDISPRRIRMATKAEARGDNSLSNSLAFQIAAY